MGSLTNTLPPQDNILHSLNPMQREAAGYVDGPLLILAGAGSGKTRVLTHRIAYIIANGFARPGEIMAVTFTNKAAEEMKNRISELLSAYQISAGSRTLFWCGTFHSVCVKVLRKEAQAVGINPKFSIYDATDSLSVVKEAMKRLNIDKKKFSPHAIRATISSAKNELISPQEYLDIAESYFLSTVADIYPVYQKILDENNAYDFDDLIFKTFILFRDHPQILGKYKHLFKFILVDEYQDTNKAQYVVIKLLSNNNLCVVGDDDQSIYGFRGANITNILNFERDFPNSKIVKLEQNYRSTQPILDASHSVVKHVKSRRAKRLWTEKKGGNPITVYRALDETDEAEWVSLQCEDIIKTFRSHDIAVLYRTNAQSRSIEESFIKHDLPYKIVGGVRFYDRKEVKDILAYLKTLQNPKDSLSLERIINYPRRGIGAKTIETIRTSALSMGLSPTEFLKQERMNIKTEELKNFTELLFTLEQNITKYKLSDFINFVLNKTGYIEFLDDGTIESQGRIENIQELVSVASRYDGQENRILALEHFLEDISLLEDKTDKTGDFSKPAITLMTVHAAKGLEHSFIFVVGMEEMLFPHARSYANPAELDEERRLAYVAITRARESLYLSYADSRVSFGKIQTNPRSRFINDIPASLLNIIVSPFIHEDDAFSHFYEEEPEKELPKVNVGDRVKHDIFGTGVITDISHSTATIDFGPIIGEKELALEYAPLEKL